MMIKAILLLIILSTSTMAETIPCFTPQEKCLPMILHEMNKAQKRIWLQGYVFTSRPIEEVLVESHKRGLDVRIILDHHQARQKYSVASSLAENGIDVFLDHCLGIAHSKIIIADDKVLTGSYNWTNSAEKRGHLTKER